MITNYLINILFNISLVYKFVNILSQIIRLLGWT